MQCLLDSNAILMLSAFDLTKEALKVLSCRRSDVRVIATEVRRFRGNGNLRRNHVESTIQRSINFAKDLPSPNFPTDEFDTLAAVQGIDPGEAVLYAATMSLPDFRLVTDDQKSLKAAMLSPACEDLRRRLAGRVLSVAQVLLLLIDRHGYEFVRERVGPNCRCDPAIEEAFGSGRYGMTEESTRHWLDGQVARLRAATGTMLMK